MLSKKLLLHTVAFKASFCAQSEHCFNSINTFHQYCAQIHTGLDTCIRIPQKDGSTVTWHSTFGSARPPSHPPYAHTSSI